MKHIYLLTFLKNYLFLFIIGFFSVQSVSAQNCGITGDIEVCKNEVASYSTATSGEIYQWNAYNGIVSGTGPTVDVNWNNPGSGELTLVVKDSLNQVVCTQSMDITIHPLPTPTIQPSFETSCSSVHEGDEGADGEDRNPCFSVCDSAWITYSTPYHSGSTYSWSVSGSAVVDSTTPHQIDVFWTGTGTGLVEVTETDANGCTGTDEICVEILPKPLAGINSEPAASGGVINACLEQPIQFMSNSSAGAGSPIWTYTWVFGDGNTEVLNASESNGNTTYDYSSPGTYNAMLIVENECHCKDTAFVTVEVSSDPGLTIECISTVCPGSTVTYTTDTTCTDYLWSATNGTIEGDSTNSEVTVTWGNTSPAYLTVSTHGCSGICSSATTVEIPVISPSATIHGEESVCHYACETYTLDCNIPVDSIIWHFPAGVTVQSDTINEHEVKVCFYDPNFTGGQIEVEYYHNTPGSQNELSCGGTALLDIEARPRLYLNYPEEICDSSELTVNYNYATSGGLEWTITDVTGSTSYPSHFEPATGPLQFVWDNGPGLFKITVTDLSDNYCDAPDSFILRVNELPAPPDSIFGPDPVCAGVPYQYYGFSTAANYSLNWEFENGSPAQNTGQTASVVWDNSGPYVISAYQINPVTGCKSTKLIDTVESHLPLVDSDIFGNDTVCANGQQDYHTTSPGDDFVWTVSPEIAGSVVSGQHEQNITVEWNNYNGLATLTLARTVCNETVTTDYDVEVIAPPTPGINIPIEACQGAPVTMSATGTSATFTWDFGDGTTATGSTVTHVFQSAGNQIVTVEANYSGFCTSSASATATIMINPKPNISISTPDPTIYCGTVPPVNLYVASPVTSDSYDWYSNSSGSALASGTNYTTSTIDSYYVIGENTFGCIDTSNVIPIDTTCGDCTPLAGSFVEFTRTRLDCNIDSFAGNYSSNASSPVYNFDDPFSGSNVVAGQNATHTFTEPGYYRVKLCVQVPDQAGTDSCTICYTEVDTINYIPDFIDSTYCANGSNTVSVKLINNTKVLSTAPVPTYEWFINSGGVASTNVNPTFNLAPGTYDITLLVNGVCEITKTITIDDLPNADIVAMDSMCVQAPIAFTNLSSGTISSYEWDFGDGATSLVNNPLKTYSTAGAYNVSLKITNSYGCTDSSSTIVNAMPNTLQAGISALSDTVFCASDSVALQSTVTNGYPGYNYLWSTVETTPDIWAQYTGSYYLEVTDSLNCYSRSNNIGVLVNPVPQPIINGDEVVCYNAQEVFTVNYPNDNFTFEWTLNGMVMFPDDNKYYFYPNNMGTNTLSVKVMSADSCVGYDTVNIEVVPNPSVGINTPGTMCAGETHLLEGFSNSTNITHSYWNNGSTDDNLWASAAGSYTYTVIDSLGCSADATRFIHPLPDFCGLMTGCYDICDTVTELVWHAPQGYATYQWLYEGNPISGSIYDTLNVPLHQSGNYQVVIGTSMGCTDTSEVIQIDFVPCDSCDVTATHKIDCGPLDENGNQTYNVTFTIDNGFGPGALVSIYSSQGPVTGISPSTIPLGISTVTATFTDLAPVDTTVCFNVTLSYENERCGTEVLCSELPECDNNCEFSVFSSCAHCEDETADGWQYTLEVTVDNIYGANGNLSVASGSGGTFGTISPNPVPPGLTTIEIPFFDTNPHDSIICFTLLMEVNDRICAADLCIYLPDCEFIGLNGANGADFKVMPNPARDQITVNGAFKPGATLSILSVSGNVCEIIKLNAKKLTIPVDHLKPGPYFIRVVQQDGVKQQLFIKK